MTETQALEIIAQVLKDRKNWGESAGIRVAQYELVNALLALERRFTPEYVTKDELTLANRRTAAANAQLERAKSDVKRLMEQRDMKKDKHGNQG